MKSSWLFLTTLFFMVLMQKAVASSLIKIPVNDFAHTELDRAIELTGSNELDLVILDCQSFIMGLNIYEEDPEGRLSQLMMFLLDERECEDHFDFITNAINGEQSLCIIVDPEKYSLEIEANFRNCDLDL